MKTFLTKLFLSLFFLLFFVFANAQNAKPEYALVIHGGAGSIVKGNLSAEDEKAYISKMTEALNVGDSILKNNGSAVDAVEAVISILEDSPLFNAGKGAVFTNEGKNELDASIMEGKNHNAGAVAGVTTIKNPIKAAKLVMTTSKHVFMAREGAEKFAESKGLEIVDTSYFFTQKKYDYLMKVKKREKEKKLDKHGTVGCVALDKKGNIAAGTSTGGMTNKMYGRIGDSPVIGAGTYADNQTCGVSATGHGEHFIRNVVAYDIAARMKYLNETLEKSANYIINDKLKKLNANGGVIALDKNGNIAMPFNTSGMFRGYKKSNGKTVVLLYKD